MGLLQFIRNILGNRRLEREGKVDRGEIRLTQVRGLPRNEEGTEVTTANKSISGENEYYRVVRTGKRKN